MIYVLSGGGNGLNFRVFSGTTAPSNPKLCDIWIKTGLSINYVDIMLVNLFPDNALHNGRCIVSGNLDTNGFMYPFASVKAGQYKVSLRMQPTGCKICANGVWQSVDAYIYKGSQWVQFSSVWNGELFDSGGQYTDVTGGWTGYDSLSNGIMTVTTGVAKTNNVVSFSGYTTLNFHITSAAGIAINEPWVGVRNASGTEVATAKGTLGSDKTLSVNISELSSGCPFMRMTYHESYIGTLKVDRVWMS